MPATILQRPDVTDYAPYFARYIAQVPSGDLLAVGVEQGGRLALRLTTVGESRAGYRYAPDKWTVREVVGHLIDTERVFAYRAAHFSRGDRRPLPSFDQDAWIPFGDYNTRALADLLDEWTAVRQGTLALLRGLPEAALARRGIASDMEFTVLAVACIIIGHAEHHLTHLSDAYAAAVA